MFSRNNQCTSCKWEKETGKKVDTSRSRVAWAEKIGVSEASVRRHLKHSPAANTLANEGDKFLTDLDLPEEIVTSRGKSVRLADGSWEKVTWQPNKKALLDTLRYDDLKAALDGWEPVEYRPRSTPGAAVLSMSDLQIGKANQRWGGTPETLESAKKSIDLFAYHLIETGINTAVLIDGGDPIENCFNVPSQLVTNDLSVPEQIRVFRRLMLEAIKTIAPLVKTLYYVTVPSNHGAHRTGYKSPGGTVDADFGLEISYQLEDAVNENARLSERVTFVRPKPLDETAELEVAGTRLAVNHGHQSGGVFAHGKWWKSMDHGRMAGWDADILVTAHFHTQAVYQSGNGRWVVASASSDPGSDWFTNRTGESATRGMTAFDLSPAQPGVPLNVRVL